MSIPLVQKAEKDDINTSIIAIKRYIDRINQLLGLSDSGSGSDPDLSGLATKQELQDAVNSLQPVDEVTLNNMQSVTSNAVSKVMTYSTSEQFTGKYFIDGKKIYRKCYIETNAGEWSNNQTIDTISNIETYIGSCLYAYFQGSRNSYISNNMIDSARGLIMPNVNGDIRVGLSGTINTVKKWGWVEYTKTTD